MTHDPLPPADFPTDSTGFGLDLVKTQAQSRTIRALLVGIVALVASFGVKWTVSDPQIDRIADAAALLIPLASMVLAWVFRVYARARIEASSKITPGAGSTLLVLPLAAVLLGVAVVAGCRPDGSFVLAPPTTQHVLSPLGEVDVARQAYTTALQTMAPLIEAKVIRDPATLKDLKETSDQIARELDDAEAKARAGGGFDFRYVLDRVKAGTQRLQEYLNARKAGKEAVWQVPQSQSRPSSP